MATKTELLPLPEWMSRYTIPTDGFECDKVVMLDDRMHAYARACVARATAAKDAEIEALRAEVETWKTYARGKDGLWRESVRHAERLTEALRHQRWCRTCAEDGWESCEDGRKADALLHPTTAQENNDA